MYVSTGCSTCVRVCAACMSQHCVFHMCSCVCCMHVSTVCSTCVRVCAACMSQHCMFCVCSCVCCLHVTALYVPRVFVCVLHACHSTVCSVCVRKSVCACASTAVTVKVVSKASASEVPPPRATAPLLSATVVALLARLPCVKSRACSFPAAASQRGCSQSCCCV